MSKYLLIDTEQMVSGGDFRQTGTPLITISTNCILSEEETMEKFRECFDVGRMNGYSYELKYSWEKIKNTL